MSERRLTAHGLAVKAELNVNAIRDILSGKSKHPRTDTLNAICKALDNRAGYWLFAGMVE